MNHHAELGTPARLDKTVRALCLLVQDRMSRQNTECWTEPELRKELVGCILGSQVRHETAVASTETLELAGLLDDSWWSDADDRGYEAEVFDVLAGGRTDLALQCRHRFPATRARQIAQARRSLAVKPLEARLAESTTPRQLRRCLVADVPGIGPKQASMFLRNTGVTFSLAILDTHVLRFLAIQGLLPEGGQDTGTLNSYERTECAAIAYADEVGYPPGYLDWAIWATMKAAREAGL